MSSLCIIQRVAHHQHVFTTTRPHADRHIFTISRRLQCSPFTLALRINRCERQSTGRFNQHFHLFSPQRRYSRKALWECRSQFSGCIISISLLITSSECQTHTTMSSNDMPIFIGLQTTSTSSLAWHRTYINLKKDDWTGYKQEIERKISSRHLPTDYQKGEQLLRATLLKAASHHNPTGRRKLYTQQVTVEIVAMMEERDVLRMQDPASPRSSTMTDEITTATSDYKRRQWREFVESIDHRTDSTKLWRTIK